MKKSFSFFILTFCLITSVSSQSCMPEGIIFSNQAAINNFQANYPGCTEIEGDVTISGNNITNLNGINVVTYIGGSLRIDNNPSLVSLAGLENISHIGGGLSIHTNVSLSILSALSNIDLIGGDFIFSGNPLIANFAGLTGLVTVEGDVLIENNINLEDMTGLQNLDKIKGSLTISENESLLSLSGLQNLDSILVSLTILYNVDLVDLNSLTHLKFVGANLDITDNYSLTSLSGLDHIAAASIDNLTIVGNSSLTECNIQSVCSYLANPAGSVNIVGNHSPSCQNPQQVANECGFNMSCLPFGNYLFELQSDIDNFSVDYPGCTELEGDVVMTGWYVGNVQGLSSITRIGGDLRIIGCLSGETNFDGLNNLEYIGGDFIMQNSWDLSSMNGLENLDTIGGNFSILTNYELTSLTGLANLKYIGGNLEIHGNGSLVSIYGLNPVTYIGGELIIETNGDLTSLFGLDNVGFLGGSLRIIENQSLNDLTGLEAFNSIGGDLEISHNYYLLSLSSLDSLSSINGDLEVTSNYILTSLAGLDNIDEATIRNLTLTYNGELTECDVLSICNYIFSPNGSIDIEYNETGCYNAQQVYQACLVDVPVIADEPGFLIYPNPADEFVNIITGNDLGFTRVIILDKLGRRVKYDDYHAGTINVSTLPSGLYVIELVTGKTTMYQKLVIIQ